MWSGVAAIATIAFGLIGIVYNKNRKESMGDKTTLDRFDYEVNGLAERFLHIYKSHNISHAEIPNFIRERSKLSLADLSSNSNILQALNEEILSATCKQFGVRLDWLNGKDISIYPSLYFDKQLEKYIEFLNQLRQKHISLEAFALKCPEDKLVSNEPDFDIGLMFRGNIDDWCQGNGEPIWRYYPLQDYNYWGYTRTRIQLKTMIYIAYLFDISMFGCQMTKDEIKAIREGKLFPEPLLADKSYVAWRPDDYVFCDVESFTPLNIEEARLVIGLIKEQHFRQLEMCEAINKDRLRHSKIISHQTLLC